MSEILDRVKAHYSRHPYPASTLDITAAIARGQRPSGCPTLLGDVYWPRGAPTGPLDILIAGCGTREATLFGLCNPDANVYAADISAASLDISIARAKAHGASNVVHRELPIERVEEFNRDFDLIISNGVLHHLDDPGTGLQALRTVLKPHGVMYLMVYASYGRQGVYMLQEYCRLLNAEADEASLGEIAHVLQLTPATHPIRKIFKNASDLSNASGLADMFLNPRDRAYSVPQVHGLVRDAGLEMLGWAHRAYYEPECCALADSPHFDAVRELPVQQRHAAVELFRGDLIQHTFITTDAKRPHSDWDLGFAGDDWKSYVPIRRHTAQFARGGVEPPFVGRVVNSDHRLPVNPARLRGDQAQMFAAIDGKRTIAEIAADLEFEGDKQQVETHAGQFFKSLHHFDAVAFKFGR